MVYDRPASLVLITVVHHHRGQSTTNLVALIHVDFGRIFEYFPQKIRAGRAADAGADYSWKREVLINKIRFRNSGPRSKGFTYAQIRLVGVSQQRRPHDHQFDHPRVSHDFGKIEICGQLYSSETRSVPNQQLSLSCVKIDSFGNGLVSAHGRMIFTRTTTAEIFQQPFLLRL